MGFCAVVGVGVEEGDVGDNVGVGVVVCSVFCADGVVVDVVNVSVEGVCGVYGKLKDVVCVTESEEPMVCGMTVMSVVEFKLE